MARKHKALLYIPDDDAFNALIEKIAARRKSEGKVYRRYGKMEHTFSEVVIDALNEYLQLSGDKSKESK